MTRHRSITAAVSLVVVGIVLLIGCIPIPASRQYQIDGRPRPERMVGTDPNVPVQLGRTSFADAFIELSRHTRSIEMWGGLLYSVQQIEVPTEWSIGKWQISPDGRRFA